MVVALGPGKFYGSSLPRPRIYTDVKFNDKRIDPPAPVLDPLMSWALEAHWSMGGLSFKRLRLQGRIEGNIKKLRAERVRFLKKRNQISDATSRATHQIGGSGEGSVEKKVSSPSPPPAPMATKRRRFVALVDEEDDDEEVDRETNQVEKRKNGSDEEIRVRKGKKPVRKLWDEFDRVAKEGGLGESRESPVKSQTNLSETVASRTRSRRSDERYDGTESIDAKVGEDAIKFNSNGRKLKGGEMDKRGSENIPSTPIGRSRTSPRLAKR
ncbi:hypothetical protein U1Q18_024636 [Sarracenia purpurea var. burkii]